MTPSDTGSTDAHRKMQANSARIAAQMAPSIKLDPATIGALNKIASMSPVLDAVRDRMAKEQLAPALATFNQATLNPLVPELARAASSLYDVNAARFQLATSTGMQTFADSVRSYQQLDTIIPTNLIEATRTIIENNRGTEELVGKLFQTTGFADALQNISAMNVQVGNFTEMYAKITMPLTESLRAAYEGTKFLDNFDFSLLDDIDEEAFEGFLDEHPELEETYESIERTLVRRGLISKETFSRAGTRFKSSTVAKHLMIAMIMFSAGAALLLGAKSLPDDLEDEGFTYLGVVGFLYTAYSVHSLVKKSVAQPPETE